MLSHVSLNINRKAKAVWLDLSLGLKIKSDIFMHSCHTNRKGKDLLEVVTMNNVQH